MKNRQKSSFDGSGPKKILVEYECLDDKRNQNLVQNQIAYHHAGLTMRDRRAIEKLFKEGKILWLCCTSTLAVGVNLPAHLVVINTTKTYADGQLKEYTETEIQQMVGRAGRPQVFIALIF